MSDQEPDDTDVSADHGIMGLICIEGKDIDYLVPVEFVQGTEPRSGRAAIRVVAGLQNRRVAVRRAGRGVPPPLDVSKSGSVPIAEQTPASLTHRLQPSGRFGGICQPTRIEGMAQGKTPSVSWASINPGLNVVRRPA